jgi:hypothetical protein
MLSDAARFGHANMSNPLKAKDFQADTNQGLFLCHATKYYLRAGVRHRSVVEIKKKKLSFETAVTKSLDTRTYFWMDYFGKRGPSRLPRDLMGIQDFRSLCGSVIDGIAFSIQTILEENVMKLDSKSGATLAAAAATLFLAGATLSTVSTTAYAAGGKCMAGNACKGQSACKGNNNSCKGLNACKGTGFSMTSAKACEAMGAKFVKS